MLVLRLLPGTGAEGHMPAPTPSGVRESPSSESYGRLGLEKASGNPIINLQAIPWCDLFRVSLPS